jgi:hypothetical protein
MVQTTAACTVQLYLNGQPFGCALSVAAGTIIFFPGTLLVNNEKLSLSVSAATTIMYEVVWIKDHYAEAINQNAVLSNVSPASTAQPVNIHKATTIETTSPLAANGVFTGAWHDSTLDGTMFVMASAFANQQGTIQIQESDDITNANFTHSLFSSTITANTLGRVIGLIKCRYWRVVFTNGATIQTSFELTTTGSDILGGLNVSGDTTTFLGPLTVISSPVGVTNTGDNLSIGNFTTFPQGGGSSGAALEVFTTIFGGAFSGTANAALQGWSRPRTSTVFKQVSTAATGNTAIWTPGSGNKFRLLKFKIQVTANASLAAAGILTVTLEDAAVALALAHEWWLPAAAGASQSLAYDSGWFDLGKFGILSAAANNALNVNLSAALATGAVNVLVCGTEE